MGDTNASGSFGEVWLKAYNRTVSSFTHYGNSSIPSQDYIAMGY